MKRVIHTDSKGRKSYVDIPDDAPDSHARYGVVVGPPDLSGLRLPPDITTKLHNELFNRGVITEKDALRRRGDVQLALVSALKINVSRIVDTYRVE